MSSVAQPTLFLDVEQGPKSGCRLQCKAAVRATIGRARANLLQISRDSGISQKHLCIEWRDDDGEAGWVAMDLGSSNGTIINDVQIKPHKGFTIQNGDLIKIGAETTIRVEIMHASNEAMTIAKTREDPQRKGMCRRHQRKVGDASGKLLTAHECHNKPQDNIKVEVYHCKQHFDNGAEECHGKQQDVKEGEVCHGKHNLNNTAEEGDGKQQGTMTAYNGHAKTPANSAAKGHGKKEDTTTTYKDHGKCHIKSVAEEGHGRQLQDAASSYENCGKQQSIVASTSRRNEPETKGVAAAGLDVDLDMTVEQWFQHLMEEGPKYLYQVSEAIIQEVMLESKQFDEYVLSLH